jgi:hypothetical protein
MAWFSPHAQESLAVNASESDAMLIGRVTADVVTTIVGVAEFAAGVGIGTGGTVAACGTTLCLGAAVTVSGGSAVAAFGATTALSGAAGLGGNLAEIRGGGDSDSSNSGPSITFNQRNLQHEYYGHASDFGIFGKWNKENGRSFQQAILDHINNKDTQVFQGTYRGNISG